MVRENHRYRLLIVCLLLVAILALCIRAQVRAGAATQIHKVKLSVRPLDLSRPPTTDEIMAAGQLGGQLYFTHEAKDRMKEKEFNASFGEAIQEWNKHEYRRAANLFRQHIKKYPDSPWASEAALHVGCDAQYHGKYSEAEESFNWILDRNRDKDEEGAKLLISKTKGRLGILKVYQNNFAEAKRLFTELKKESPDWRDRTYAAHWLQRLSRYSKDDVAMLNCGTQALAHLLEMKGKQKDAQEVMQLVPGTTKGHSIQAISDIASRHGYSLVPVKITEREIQELPLPAIMQIGARHAGDSGHYWILDDLEGDRLGLFDPQAGRRFDQSLAEFSREWSGNVLVFSDGSALPGRRMAKEEAGEIFGGCCGARRAEDDQGDPKCDAGPTIKPPEGDCPGCGSPIWSVNMINLNLYVTDTPLWYRSPIGPPVEIKLSYNSQSSIAYNEPFGNKWQFNYSSYLVVDTGEQVTIFMPDGRRDIYSSNGSGGYYRPYQVFNTLTKVASNHYTLKFPDGTLYTYKIPPGTSSLQPFLIEIKDLHGQTLTFTYDSGVHLTTIADALGRDTTLSYYPNGLVQQVVDPFGRTALFEYDANSSLAKITDMGGYWSSLTYDADVNLTSIGNPRGTWNFLIEPADGIVANSDNYPPPGSAMWENYRITITNPLQGKEEYFYYGGCDDYGCNGYSWYVSPRYYVPWKSQTVNNFKSNPPKTRYFPTPVQIQQHREIAKILYPEGDYSLYGYDSVGNLATVKDAHGHTTQYTYNTMGRVTSTIDARGTITTRTYWPNNVDLKTMANGLGTVSLTYYATHDVETFTDQLGHLTTYSYTPYGQPASTIDAKGYAATFAYGADHRLASVTRDGKTIDVFTHDPIGRVRTYTNRSGLTLTYDYDALNNIVKVTFPDSKFVGWTYSSCCTQLLNSVADRAGRMVAFTYDPLKRLVNTTNSQGAPVRRSYDSNGNVVKLVDTNSNVTQYTYDRNDRLTKKTYQNGKYTVFEYDNAGLMHRRTNGRGITSTYGYDNNHNLSTVDFSDNTPDIAYTYDAYDRMDSIQDGTGTYQFSYYNDSRLQQVNGPWDNDTIIYSYDEIGRMNGIALGTMQAVSYNYDPTNRLEYIRIGSADYAYSYRSITSDLVQTLTRPNGSVTEYSYDTIHRRTEVMNKTASGLVIDGFAYAFDNMDLIASETITNTISVGAAVNGLTIYNYDGMNQLLSTTTPPRTFQYDDDGNLTRGYIPQGYEFTASYDAEDRLKSIVYTDSANVARSTEYIYHGDALAITKKYENATLIKESRYISNNLLPMQERDGQNNVITENVWGLSQGGGIEGLLDLRQAGQAYSYLYDGKGNVSAIIDGAQMIVANYRYDPFGDRMAGTGTLSQPFQFSTKSFDEELGLSYFGFRFYSASLGRWMNRDPLGEKGGVNLYEFVGCNPIMFVDPFGLIMVCNRATDWGHGLNHSYLWSDVLNRGWGQAGSSGRESSGGHEGEEGPEKDKCVPVEGSENDPKLDGWILDYFKHHSDDGMWAPFVNDCHKSAKDAIETFGLKYPGAPGGRFGKRE